MGAIFLSASVPVLGREPFDKDSEPQIIQAAVSALATVAMGRKKIVWGGHPAITPMMWASAEELGVKFADAVHLFQSKFFSEEDFPEENKNFGNVTYIDAVLGDLERSLLKMRQSMMGSQDFEGAIFIGGMQGILDEYVLFKAICPHGKCVIVSATGGASRILAADAHYSIPADLGPLDFIRLFYRELTISPAQRRSQYL
ncbi:MAG: hypothetical protein JWQ01_2557 [Massilia sp.]|nr:hypothetical protein [Massilia sp.]